MSACGGSDGRREFSARRSPPARPPSRNISGRETKGGASVNVYPEQYRAEILAYQRSYLNDPTGIRSAGISRPALKNVGVGDRYVACVRFNAKGPTGAYTGVRETW